MKQMRKLSQGLSGERLTPEPEEKKKNDFGGKGKGGESEKQEGDATAGAKAEEGQNADQWAEQQGGLELGEIGRRSNYVGEVEGNVLPAIHTSVETPFEEQDPIVQEEDVGEVEREAARRLKKEKRKAEKQESPTKRRKVADGD
jgi:type II secretory pathway component HofQ